MSIFLFNGQALAITLGTDDITIYDSMPSSTFGSDVCHSQASRNRNPVKNTFKIGVTFF